MSIPAPNFTQLPNVVLDSLSTVTNPGLRLMLAICRQTQGWHRSTVKMSVENLMKATGMAHGGIHGALEELLKKDWIERYEDGNTFCYRIKYDQQPFPFNPDTAYKSSVQNMDSKPTVQSLDVKRQTTVQSLDTPNIVKEKKKDKERSHDKPGPSQHQAFMKLWFDGYLKCFGRRYASIAPAGDGSAVKLLLESTGLSASELFAVAEKAWALRFKKFWCKNSVAIAQFASGFNHICDEIDEPTHVNTDNNQIEEKIEGIPVW